MLKFDLLELQLEAVFTIITTLTRQRHPNPRLSRYQCRRLVYFYVWLILNVIYDRQMSFALIKTATATHGQVRYTDNGKDELCL